MRTPLSTAVCTPAPAGTGQCRSPGASRLQHASAYQCAELGRGRHRCKLRTKARGEEAAVCYHAWTPSSRIGSKLTPAPPRVCSRRLPTGCVGLVPLQHLNANLALAGLGCPWLVAKTSSQLLPFQTTRPPSARGVPIHHCSCGSLAGNLFMPTGSGDVQTDIAKIYCINASWRKVSHVLSDAGIRTLRASHRTDSPCPAPRSSRRR